ncbi:hypothetical protein WA588_005003 [Blastocystis sp. NMH]
MGNVVSWYINLIETHTIPTKVITSGILYAVGDCISQSIEKNKKHRFDFWRCVRMLLWGFVFGLIVHFWYQLLDRIRIPNAILCAVVKMLTDQFTGSIVVTFLMFVFCSLLEIRTVVVCDS